MEKRELPTRHNFLTEAVKNLLEPKITSNEPFIDSNSIITVTSDPKILKKYERHDIPAPQLSPIIEHVPQVTLIKPIAKKSKSTPTTTTSKKESKPATMEDDDDAILSDDYYLKRHRRHEKEEKIQKNREKERLKHGYYQQKQLVERIKTMDKSLLQSIVSSIRHRTNNKEECDEEEYLDDLHCRLLNDAVEHLRRYEVLGLSNNKQGQEMDDHDWNAAADPSSPVPTPTNSNNTNSLFHQAVQSEVIKQRERQIKSFSKQPMFAGDSIQRDSRRSTRHVIAFGQKLPEFDTQEFSLPSSIIQWKKEQKT